MIALFYNNTIGDDCNMVCPSNGGQSIKWYFFNQFAKLYNNNEELPMCNNYSGQALHDIIQCLLHYL